MVRDVYQDEWSKMWVATFSDPDDKLLPDRRAAVADGFAPAVAADRIERLVLPLRDAFAAVFFFVFGLTIDPSDGGG